MSSAVERDNPPTRRKSCEACRAAKRRCDLALPACFRCVRRCLDCVYPGLPPADLIPDMLSILNDTESGSRCQSGFTLTSMPGLDMNPGFSTTFDEQVEFAPVDSHPEYLSLAEQPALEVIPLKTGPTITLSALLASRFQYAIDTLKDTPRMMVMENQTLWCHRELYREGMPKVMQDAYACCALFITKNPINAAMITTHIQSRHQELLLSQLPTSPPEVLAHAQALLLYQIMHFFDPDLSSNISTDSLSISALESAAFFLFSSTHFPPEEEEDQGREGGGGRRNIESTMTMQFWKQWLWQESARRTILFTFYFLQIFRLLRGERNLKCDGKLGILHSWYLSAHLWNAPTASEFAVAWAEREHFIVHNVNFSRVLGEAQPADVDCFGRMLLVTLLGVEQAQAWFYRRGAIL